MPRAICLLLLVLPSAGLSAAENTTVTLKLGDRQLTFMGSLKTKFEGLAVALLGSCATETTLSFSKKDQKEHWDKALQGDHLLVRFAKPQAFAWQDSQDTRKETTLHVSQILIPIGPYRTPQQIYVRSGGGYRVFSKYEVEVCDAIQKQLQRLLPLPLKPLVPQ